MKSFIKRTLIGGLLFLIPISILAIIFYKIYGFMQKIAGVIDNVIPLPKIFGIATANIVAVLFIVFICFLLGLLANNKNMNNFKNMLEKDILMKIPGYLFIKAYTKGLEMTKKENHELDPVLVIFDDNAQMGFLIDEAEEGLSSVFMPGSPNPWSGSVIYVEKDRIKQLNITTNQAIKHLQQAGKNSEFVNEKNP